VFLLVRVQVVRPDLIAPDFAARLRKLRQRQAEQPGRPLWLVLGSSRIRLGYWPESVEPLCDRHDQPILVFNFAHNGMGPVFQHLYLRRLLRERVRPDLVVLEVMPMYLHHEPNHFITRFVVAPELPAAASYVPLPALLRNEAWRQEELYPAAARSLFPGDLRRLVPPGEAFRVGRTLAMGGPGRLRKEVSDTERARRIEYLRLANPWRGTAVCERGARALRDSLALCQQNNIRGVLLLSPEGDSYRRLYAPGAQEIAGTFVRRLGEETGTTVVDARRWLAEEDFFDGEHALRQGAAKFTRRLHEEILVPLARGEPSRTLTRRNEEGR
jgi:hypothetical protein